MKPKRANRPTVQAIVLCGMVVCLLGLLAWCAWMGWNIPMATSGVPVDRENDDMESLIPILSGLNAAQ